MTAKKDGQPYAGHWDRGHFRRHLALDTPGPEPYRGRLTVRECCEARGLTVYEVAMSGLAQGTIDRGTVYRLARGEAARVDLPTLATVAGIIATLSGQPVGVADLLTFDEDGQRVEVWTYPASVEDWKARQ